MKPRTKLQKEIFDSNQYLPKLSLEQKEWAFRECLNHKGFATKTRVICMDCGDTFSPDLVHRKRATCPHCGTKVKVEKTRKRTDKQIAYFASATVQWDFQIVRNYEIIASYKQGRKAEYILKEILQYWITPDEKLTMLGLTHHLTSYCDSWGGEWGIKKNNGWYKKYEIYPHKYMPDSIFKKEYKRIGIDHRLDGFNVLDAIKIIPYNPTAETLLKARQYELLYCMKDHSGQIHRNWPSIKICLRNKYKVKDAGIWLDYLNLLQHFNKDLHNAKYVCPKDLKKAHDRLVKKKRNIQRKRDLEVQREKAKVSQIAYAKAKKAFMGIQFSKGNLQVRFLNSVQEVLEEGDILKHCVFASKYYERKTLLFSALVGGNRMATVEVDPEKMKVVQVRGKNNSPTDYDAQIKNLVNSQMHRIKERMQPKSSPARKKSIAA